MSVGQHATIENRVERAREVQLERFRGTRVHSNSQMGSRQIRRFCEPDAAGHRLLELVTERLGFSARAYTRILKVGRTIADLEENEAVRKQHLAEAIQYRSWTGRRSEKAGERPPVTWKPV